MQEDQAKYCIQLEGVEFAQEVQIDGIQGECGSSTIIASPTDAYGLYEVEIDGAVVPVFIESDGIDTVSVSIRGYTYTGRILRERHFALLSILTSSEGMQSRSVRVTTPMPGLLKTILVANGTEVRKNQQLFTLEAMKMENTITSPIHGIVRDISVTDNQAVEKGVTLCTIDPR